MANSLQLEEFGLPQPPDSTAAADSVAALREITQAVDRITEVRSWSDLWDLVAVFQVQLLGFVGKLLLACFALGLFLVLYRLARAAMGRMLRRAHVEED